MKKKIAILGSTGSIGKSLLKVISRDKKKYQIELLTANKNYKLILNQAKKFKVKKVIITDKKYYQIAISKKNKSLKVYNDFNQLKKIFPKKIDYVMSSIVGLDGLLPTYKIISFTKKIAIANKETIICAWNLIQNELKKNKTKFVPVDSEHFSIWYALKNNQISNLEKLYLTASGGPLLNVPLRNYKNLKIQQITNHPTWNMGAKISVDSSTMMNKIFEIIEAKKIFNINYKQISILIHPKSYVHAVLKFNDGMIKILAHDTTMEIPISNSLNEIDTKILKTKKINFNILNNLNLSKISFKKYPLIKILENLSQKDSLYETILVTLNDEFVKLFLSKKISYKKMISKLLNLTFKKEFLKYKHVEPKKINDILSLNKFIKKKVFHNVSNL